MRPGIMIAQAFPGWTYVRELGKGSEGSVHMIREQNGPNCGAVKVSRIWEELEPEESSSVSQQEIPHLVPVLEEIRVQDEECIPYRLSRMPCLLPFSFWEEADVIRTGVQICEALAGLHRAGYAHLDVKPENVFVDRKGDLYLGDYGTLRDIRWISATMPLMGTRHYLPPEVKDERLAPTDAQSLIRMDLYALGMMLFEMFCWHAWGEACHGRKDCQESRDAWFDIVHQRMADNPDDAFLSSDVGRVILRATAPDPLSRYASAEEMRAALIRAAQRDAWVQPSVDEEKEKAVAAMEHFLYADPRRFLMLCYQNGVHRPYGPSPYVGRGLKGLSLYWGKAKPVRMVLCGETLYGWEEECGAEIALHEFFGENTWPRAMEMEVFYADGFHCRWRMIHGEPERGWDWFKMPLET
ncbi:MAG: protein kinase [Clostridia bacterium]|nr:protein kinase [Clostridia bacterium]